MVGIKTMVGFETELDLTRVMSTLNRHNIHLRRYFSPCLNQVTYVLPTRMPISESVASRIACLPIYPGLNADSVHRIADIQLKAIQYIDV